MEHACFIVAFESLLIGIAIGLAIGLWLLKNQSRKALQEINNNWYNEYNAMNMRWRNHCIGIIEDKLSQTEPSNN